MMIIRIFFNEAMGNYITVYCPYKTFPSFIILKNFTIQQGFYFLKKTKLKTFIIKTQLYLPLHKTLLFGQTHFRSLHHTTKQLKSKTSYCGALGIKSFANIIVFCHVKHVRKRFTCDVQINCVCNFSAHNVCTYIKKCLI